MPFANQLVQPPLADYPNRLADSLETSPQSRRLWLLVAALFLLALVPRALKAWNLTVVCDDAYYYMSVADALEHGRLRRAFHYLNLNVYPVILLLLHRAGLDWAVAGKLWGALVSAATVLPLFGLARRLFDVRVAAAACFLFAIHPDLIETSVEPIREPTFWFLFVLSLFLAWRAVTACGWWRFLAAGTAIALAIHTRSEAWLLMPVIVLWAAFRMREIPTGRRRLAAGVALSLAMTPGLLIAVNLTVLHGHDRWEWGRLTHFQTLYDWLRSDVSEENIYVASANQTEDAAPEAGGEQDTAGRSPEPEVRDQRSEARGQNRKAHGQRSMGNKGELTADNGRHAGSTIAASQGAPPVATQLSRPTTDDDAGLVVPPEATTSPLADGRWKTYVRQFVRKLEPVNLILMLVGVCGWWRTILHRDKLVLTLLFCGVLLAIWVRLSQIGDMNGRYFFTAYLVAAPTAALGLLAVLDRLGRLGRRVASSERLRAVPAAGLLVVLPPLCLTDVLTQRHETRETEAVLGDWLRDEFGPFDSVMVDLGATRVGYYAQETMPTIAYFFPTPVYAYEEELGVPDLVILSKALSPPDYRIVVEHQVGFVGLRRVDEAHLPEPAREFVVFARPQAIARLAAGHGSVNRR